MLPPMASTSYPWRWMDLLLDFVPSGTLEAEAKEPRTSEDATLAHGEVGLVMKTHRARTHAAGSKSTCMYAPAERMVAEAALRAPMIRITAHLSLEASRRSARADARRVRVYACRRVTGMSVFL